MQGSDRAQAHTLEGFIGSILILTAVLFAINSVVITPTTGGTVDRDAKSQVLMESNDMLALSAESGNLSKLVRYWDGTEANDDRRIHGANSSYGYDRGYIPPELASGDLLEMLNQSYNPQKGYAVVAVYQANGKANGGKIRITGPVQQRETSVVATYTITLYDDQLLTGPDGQQKPLTWYDDVVDGDNKYYPIPDAFPNSPVYNVVTVKVIVW